MNPDLAKFSLISFVIVSVLCVLVGGVVLGIAFWKDPRQATEAVKAFFEGGNALRIATVLVILGTTTVLAFADKLSEGILALMSGIAGYVLGGLTRQERDSGKKSGVENGGGAS